MTTLRIPAGGILAGLTASILAIAAAIVAAVFVGRSGGAAVASVEQASNASLTILGNLADALPFGFAFGAGMVAAVNPCGFALLPAYLGLFLGSGDATMSTRQQIGTALRVSLAMTMGFVVLFGISGLTISLVSALLVDLLPRIGLAIGVVLAIAGGLMLSGRSLDFTLAERLADRLGPIASRPGAAGYFAYGLAFGAASLGCALPIFLAVVASTVVVEGAGAGLIQFVLYALGMGAVVSVLTITVAVLRQAVLSRVRSVVRFVQPVSAVLLIIAGGTIVFYWPTLGGIL